MAIFLEQNKDQNKSINFKKIAGIALLHAPAVLRRLLPDGRVIGSEFVARNPRRADRRPGSFKVSLTNGRWCDFATGDRGGDLIALVAYIENLSQVEAARSLSKMLGINSGGQHD